VKTTIFPSVDKKQNEKTPVHSQGFFLSKKSNIWKIITMIAVIIKNIIYVIILISIILLFNIINLQQFSINNLKEINKEFLLLQHEQLLEIQAMNNEITKNSEHRITVNHAVNQTINNDLIKQKQPKDILKEIKLLEKNHDGNSVRQKSNQ
jgi:hypothetical protein